MWKIPELSDLKERREVVSVSDWEAQNTSKQIGMCLICCWRINMAGELMSGKVLLHMLLEIDISQRNYLHLCVDSEVSSILQ